MRNAIISLLIVTVFLLAGCGGGKKAETAKDTDFTLGLVQKEIHKGMSQADVAEAIGSPNIVTKDSSEKETWVYDKIASECSYKQRSGYGTVLILGFQAGSGSYTSSQRTLTVVIKFNEQQKVESFSYHSSKF